MPIAELATLKTNDPTISILEHAQIRKIFAEAAASNEEWSGYPVTFYIDSEDTSVFYLVTGWADVDAHMKWIGSETNRRIMKELEPYVSVLGLAHLDIDLGGVPKNTRFIVYSRWKIVEGDSGGQASSLAEDRGEGLLWTAGISPNAEGQQHRSSGHKNNAPIPGYRLID